MSVRRHEQVLEALTAGSFILIARETIAMVKEELGLAWPARGPTMCRRTQS